MATTVGDSSRDDVPAVSGTHTARGPGVLGTSALGEGVVGESRSPDRAGVWGRASGWSGVVGTSVDQTGVTGVSEKFVGVWGEGKAPAQAGVFGISAQGEGVIGESRSRDHAGVWGRGTAWSGVVGTSVEQTGVTGVSERFVGLWAETKTNDHPALLAKGTRRAGRFEGDVEVTGDLVLVGADVAEQFDVAGPPGDVAAAPVDPGTVVVLDDRGALAPCTHAYDTRVAGVVSGAGDRVPALVLDRTPDAAADRRPVAVVGKVWCRADAAGEPIRVGDLLTTSGTGGHAMRAVDRDAAFGAVLGKALTPLVSGTGLVLVLVGLC
jgi:hypothetical protein